MVRKARAIRLERMPEKARLEEVKSDLDGIIFLYTKERDRIQARIIALP